MCLVFAKIVCYHHTGQAELASNELAIANKNCSRFVAKSGNLNVANIRRGFI